MFSSRIIKKATLTGDRKISNPERVKAKRQGFFLFDARRAGDTALQCPQASAFHLFILGRMPNRGWIELGEEKKKGGEEGLFVGIART